MLIVYVAAASAVPCAGFATQVGLRGYNATRQLLLAGLDAVNVSGGYRSSQRMLHCFEQRQQQRSGGSMLQCKM